ncbi:hypothetical protein T484DRAFT_1800972 [Baffinella frigidus]|nr:hypothetical protein T484DRAFT_1800972 [Cryptophyta sp. CCMP2293]
MRREGHAPFSAESFLSADLATCWGGGAAALQANITTSASAAGIRAGVHLQIDSELVFVTGAAPGTAE